MQARFSIEESLVDIACRVGNHPTPEAAIVAALREYVVRRRRQERIIEMLDAVEFDSTYDYKEARAQRCVSLETEHCQLRTPLPHAT